MFGKEADTATGQGSLNSILGQGCKVKGDIQLQGTLRIDGEFEGGRHARRVDKIRAYEEGKRKS